jgi:hypothetical protein
MDRICNVIVGVKHTQEVPVGSLMEREYTRSASWKPDGKRMCRGTNISMALLCVLGKYVLGMLSLISLARIWGEQKGRQACGGNI